MAMDIANIDRRLKIEETVTEPDIRYYDVRTAEVDIYGLYNPRRETQFIRMPMDAANAVSNKTAAMNLLTAGGRIRLKTDSEYVAIRAARPMGLNFSPHMNFVCSSGFDAYVKENGEYTFCGVFVPKVKENAGYESIVHFETRKMRDITINFPLFDQVTDLYIGVQKDAVLTHGDKYTIEKPVVYYGSSITHGGCASRPGNCYTALLSREMDYDYVNLGMAGSAKGEQAMAEYLASLDMSVFVMDYDFNSPWQDLEQTHWRMYEIFRKAQPKTPVIFASRCTLRWRERQIELTMRRRAAIIRNFEKAKAMGDDRVFYIDGQTVFAPYGGDSCTVDGVHPNDLGFYAMAKAYGPVIKQALELV